METTVMNVAVSHGIWAVLAVFLLVYIVKSNEKRDEKQEEREKNYQSVIEKLTEKLRTLYQVEFANSKKYKFQEEMNMAGTMSEKEFICLWIYNGK